MATEALTCPSSRLTRSTLMTSGLSDMARIMPSMLLKPSSMLNSAWPPLFFQGMHSAMFSGVENFSETSTNQNLMPRMLNSASIIESSCGINIHIE